MRIAIGREHDNHRKYIQFIQKSYERTYIHCVHVKDNKNPAINCRTTMSN